MSDSKDKTEYLDDPYATEHSGSSLNKKASDLTGVVRGSQAPTPFAFDPSGTMQPGAGQYIEPPPQSIPGYEIIGVLGRGGMGVVYQARHLILKRTVALKVVLAGGYAGPEQLARFRAEAEVVARLQHP